LKITEHPNEQLLLTAIGDGDQKSFEILFTHYYTPFGHYIHRLLEDRSLTEDVLQETFLKIWIHREKLPAITSFKDYLFILIRNRVYNLLKQRAKDYILFAPLDETNVHALVEPQEKEDKVELEAYYALIEAEVEKLPVQQQKIFKLAKIEKLKYEQIAQQLNLSVETVRKHLYLANKTLRDHLRGREGEFILLIATALLTK